ncbi:ImcF-related family protein [Enterobacteriaceae bacterium LUAb1]
MTPASGQNGPVYWRLTLMMMLAVVIAALLLWHYQAEFAHRGYPVHLLWMAWFAVVILVILLPHIRLLWWRWRQEKAQRAFKPHPQPADNPMSVSTLSEPFIFTDLTTHLRGHYRLFWRQRVRILLVIGEEPITGRIAPQLVTRQWLEGQETLLIYGGSLRHEPQTALLLILRKLRRWRPLDGIVWAASEEQSRSAEEVAGIQRYVSQLTRQLHWQAPLYLWLCDPEDVMQIDRPLQPVGCFPGLQADATLLTQALNALVTPLAQRGMHQVMKITRHDWQLALSQRLQHQLIPAWQEVLTPLLAGGKRVGLLGGLAFSPALAADGPAVIRHRWLPSPVWQQIIREARHVRGRRVLSPQARGLWLALWLAAGLWGAGMLLSFFNNRALLNDAGRQVQTLETTGQTPAAQLTALWQLQNLLQRQTVRGQHHDSWFLRFGLSQNTALRKALWPHYARAAQRLLRDPAAAVLRHALARYAALPAGGPQRVAQAALAHNQLRALLMLARPEKVDPPFLSEILLNLSPARPGGWHTQAPALWQFYAASLASHPQWKITAPQAQVSQIRQILLGLTGQQNAEATLYQKMLRRVSGLYGDMTLAQMVNGTDASALLTTRDVVPGIFTRQAWEEQVQHAIDEVVSERREETDWVLSDGKVPLQQAASPEGLKTRLTAHYFSDFGGAWLNFLNSLRLNPARNLSAVTDQLTLMADVRQSPLIALINTLVYQGKTGQEGPGLSGSLLRSAQNLLSKDEDAVISQQGDGITSPLAESFGPLLALMGQGQQQGVMSADSTLSLQTYLTRLTRVRLRLQQVANAPDPQEMTRVLAQTVFQGKNIDLTDTREYGSLMAASLGEAWGNFGQTVFVQPLTQAWQQVLHPSAASLNEQWRASVVESWNSTFAGRYPFSNSHNDASLPLLGQYIQGDNGRIARFLNQQLSGVLHREGNRWVADRLNSQGLNFNPAFLQAINQLSSLSDILFAEGNAGIRFELMALPVQDVAESHLIIDGQTLRYFNQMAGWQSFNWPGETPKPGVNLTWRNVNAGTRLWGEWQGNWGLIRWLEKGQSKALDNSRWQLSFKTPEKVSLNWVLRAEVGSGPLALLKLRGFRLPETIFTVNGTPDMPFKQALMDDDDNEAEATERVTTTD